METKPPADSPSLHPAVDFLKVLYSHCAHDHAFVTLRFIKGEKRREEFVPLSRLDTIPSYIEKYSDLNAYFGVATREYRKGGKDGIIEIPAVYIDLDNVKEKENRIGSFSLRPSFSIWTGGGVHYYWKLKRPARKEDIPAVENIIERLIKRLEGDIGARDASRVLRLPGTKNFKYDPPEDVFILDLEGCEYDLIS